MPKSTRENPADAIRRRLRPLRGQVWALGVLVASLTLVVVLWKMAYDRELRTSEETFISQTQDAADLLRQRMVNFELVAGGGISLFASVARPTPDQWFGYVDGMELHRRFPSVAGLGFTGYLRQSRLDELQEEWHQAGWGDLKVRPNLGGDRLAVVLYLEPRTPENLAVIGFDMFSDPVRRQAMEQAMSSGEPTLSGPVPLVQGDGQHSSDTGLLLYRPVYRGPEAPATPEARRESILGWVYVPFWVEDFVSEVLPERDLSFTIDDITDGAPERIFSRRPESAKPPAFSNAVEFENYGRRWRVQFESAPLAKAAPRLSSLQSILSLGLLASLLMYAIAWMLARTEARAQSIARRLTEEYRHSEERFRTAMEYSAIGKALMDARGTIVQANPAFGAIVGVEPDQLEGRPFDDLFEDPPGYRQTSDPVRTGDGDGVRRETRRLHRQGGEPRHVQLTYAPIPGGEGTAVSGLVQIEDVTDRLRAEARVRALNRTLEARVALRTRELSQSNEELEAFAYSVSHDLRAPLRAIDGFSRVLVERYGDAMDESGRDYLGRVRSAAGRMGELIDALLKMSRVGRGALKTEAVDLSRMAREIIDDLRAGDPERADRVEVVIEPGLQASGDAALLRNLLVNLLGNAWKFTRDRDSARIELGREGDEFFVRDNGAGFPQDYVGKLFRPFQRLHAQSEFDGHGIGLASAKRVVQRHGGVIRAEGSAGEGASFHFTLATASDEAD
ncbi:CHASE domain-containing protein [Lysobacter sp. H21R4]|uniref:CHASE domain-containing protein n=1 Tax=Lysobacter sp. H21R4 TaxID=2781021 RepID=UPI0018884688|nr:CHASE domain-containing protein [Lysobacter sp. H21R4]QOY61766.1 CHASE domain-containing protein [Lysobacter sp. H21R4]